MADRGGYIPGGMRDAVRGLGLRPHRVARDEPSKPTGSVRVRKKAIRADRTAYTKPPADARKAKARAKRKAARAQRRSDDRR